MDEHLRNKMNLLLFMFVIGATVTLLMHTPNWSIGLCLLSCSYAVLVFIRDYIVKLDLGGKTGTVILVGQMIVSIVIAVWSESFFAQIYLLILIGEFTFYRSRKQAIVFTIVSYISIMLGVLSYRQQPLYEDIYILFPRVIDFFAVFGMSLFAQIAFRQKNRLAEDNEQLRIAAIELEQKAKLEERTRISREIHDSVGHTLTSAITGLQTAAHALRKNNDTIALEMIERTQLSIRGGLNDVRTSVQLLRENKPGIPFKSELVGLVQDTIRQTGTEIAYHIDPTLPELPPMVEITIYRALQEGLTNGLRHGAGTQFRFSLTHRANLLRFVLSDNGRAPHPIVPGFGLKAMEERVADVGGELAVIAGAYPDGVTLEITIPFHPGNERTEGVS